MILDKSFPPDPRVENEAMALINEGHQVFLFCLGYKNDPIAEEIKGIQVKRFDSNILEYKLSALAYTFPFYSHLMGTKISKFLINNGIEAIHIHDMVVAEATFTANKKLDLPVILDLHENRPEIMKFYPHLQKFPAKYLISPDHWKKKEEEFIKKSSKTIVVTQEAKNEIRKRVPVEESKIVVVPNTVKKSFYTDIVLDKDLINKYKDKFVILYLGDTGLRRGLMTGIDAVKSLKDKIKNLKLVIVGSNSSDSILKDRVKSFGLEEYVDFEGWKDVSLFPSYIHASHIGISPLHKNIHHDTTYANKLFQYMSFGKPVIVSDATAQRNLIERTKSGLVHIEKDVQDFSDKVMHLYQDNNLRNKLGENGNIFIENEFCWERVSKELVNIYRDMK